MGWFGESDEEKEARVVQEAHEEGQKDGSEGVGAVFGCPTTTELYYSHVADGASSEAGEAYKAGYENGRNNQPNDD